MVFILSYAILYLIIVLKSGFRVMVKVVKKKSGGQRPGSGRPKGSGKYREATRPMRIPNSLVPDVQDLLSQYQEYPIDPGSPVELQGFEDFIYKPVTAPKKRNFPLFATKVAAGFPSPADDYLESKLDLNQYLVKHPAATFFVRVEGESMLGAGIHPDDILVVDRSIKPTEGKIIIAVINGELTVKRLKIRPPHLILMPENSQFSPIFITEDMSFSIWGVVTNVIHPL